MASEAGAFRAACAEGKPAMKLSTLIFLLPVVILAALFAVANRQEVIVRLDPFARADTALTVGMPLYLLVFMALIAGVLLAGAAATLGRGGGQRDRLKTREIGDAIVTLEANPAPPVDKEP